MDNENPPDAPSPAPPPPLLRSPTAPPPLASAPPPTRRRWSGWIIAAIVGGGVLVLLLISGSLLGTVRRLAFSSSPTATSQHGLQETVVRYEGSRHKVALVELHGIITSGAFDRSGYNLVDYVRHQLKLAGQDPRVRAVVLSIDSPGGEVLASDEIYRAIDDFQDEHDKPVVASMQGLAASGGYYTAAPCRWIVAHELTLTGSIGVILHAYNYRGLLNKVGVRPEVYKSGRFKDMLSGEKLEEQITPEERLMLQELVDQSFNRFKKVVREGRESAAKSNNNQGRPLAGNWEEFADGRILTGQQAFENGFVDELGNFDTALKRAFQLARIPDANLVRYQRVFDLGNLFRLLGKTESATVKIDLGLELPQLQAGRPYFLAPALVH